jgi:glycosyltransferase 2 family protein
VNGTARPAAPAAAAPQRFGAGLKLAAAAAILALLFRRFPLNEVLAEISSVAAGALIVAALLALVSQVLLAYRLIWLSAVQHISVTMGQALDINLSSGFYGLFLPGGNASRLAVRAYKLAQPSKEAVASVATILFDRLTATAALGFFGQACWLLDQPGETPALGLLLFATWVAPAALWLLGRSTARPAGHGKDGAAARSDRIRRKLRQVVEAARHFAHMQRSVLGSVMLVSLTLQAISAVVYVFLAVGLGIEIGFVTMAWIACTTAVLAMAPVTPSGIGVREGALVYLLGRVGVPGPEALALSLSFFACTIVFPGLLGGLVEGRRWMRPAEA